MTEQRTEFLTAQQLKITENEREALIWVFDNLKAGNLANYDAPADDRFNMNTIFEQYGGFGDCATVACLGGWMAIRMGMDMKSDVHDYVHNKMSESLRPLCFPGCVEGDHIAQTIVAAESFLTSGNALWPQVSRRAINTVRGVRGAIGRLNYVRGSTKDIGTTDREKVVKRLDARLAQRALEKRDASER